MAWPQIMVIVTRRLTTPCFLMGGGGVGPTVVDRLPTLAPVVFVILRHWQVWGIRLQ